LTLTAQIRPLFPSMSNYFRMFENVILFSGHERKDLPPMDWGDKGVKGTLAIAQKMADRCL